MFVTEINKHPTALSELQKLWRNTLKHNLSLACVVDDDAQPPKIIGVNVLTVVCKNDKEEPFQVRMCLDKPLTFQIVMFLFYRWRYYYL